MYFYVISGLDSVFTSSVFTSSIKVNILIHTHAHRHIHIQRQTKKSSQYDEMEELVRKGIQTIFGKAFCFKMLSKQ